MHTIRRGPPKQRWVNRGDACSWRITKTGIADKLHKKDATEGGIFVTIVRLFKAEESSENRIHAVGQNRQPSRKTRHGFQRERASPAKCRRRMVSRNARCREGTVSGQADRHAKRRKIRACRSKGRGKARCYKQLSNSDHFRSGASSTLWGKTC